MPLTRFARDELNSRAIALEEHFAIPDTISEAHDARYAGWFPAWPDIKRRLLDLDELRAGKAPAISQANWSAGSSSPTNAERVPCYWFC